MKYDPRPQFEQFHNRSQRFSIGLAHRRCGKTVAAVNELIGRGVYNQLHKPRYSYIGPYRNQAKKIAWEYIKDYSEGMTSKVSEADLTLRLAHNQAEIGVYGADNPDAFRGLYNDGVVLDEYGDMNPSVLTKNILPTLADRRGWLVLIGTPKGKNHFYDMWQKALQSNGEWYTFMLKASETGIIAPEELTLQRANMDEDEYLQEYECSFDAAIKGSYYAHLITEVEHQGRIDADIEFDDNFPVKIAMDLGYTDSTAIWFWQDRPDGLAIIDYEEAHSEPLSYYFNLLRQKPYSYSELWLPHDARAKTLQTGRSTLEQVLGWSLPGRPRIDIVPNLDRQQGIDAARQLIPKCWFNPRAQVGLECLRHYKRKWDEIKKSYSNAPDHDWSSHGADAFRYLSLVAQPRIVTSTSIKEAKKSSVIQLEPLFEDYENSLRRRSRMR